MDGAAFNRKRRKHALIDVKQGPSLGVKALSAAVILCQLAACATAPAPSSGVAERVEPAAPQRPAIDPSDLIGLKRDGLETLLGAPDLSRKEGPGEFYRYAMTNCVLIVLLYPDEKGDVRVEKIDATAATSGAPKPSVETCASGAAGAP